MAILRETVFWSPYRLTYQGSRMKSVRTEADGNRSSAAGTASGSAFQESSVASATGVAWVREMLEALAVAFILAFLFRSFVGEAFVVPTGSMAPTLMGRHRDLFCSECGFNFQVGTSQEVDASGFYRNGKNLTAAICPNCRFTMDLTRAEAQEANPSYSGDRLLVSKFAYWLRDPQRWDVSVFLFPGKARENYIKRMVGLPNETVQISQGDIFTHAAGETEFRIARKSPEKILATMRSVFDNDHVSARLSEAGVTSSWAMRSARAPGGLDVIPDGRWETTDGHQFHAVPAMSAHPSVVEDRLTRDPVWLTYQHRPLSYRGWDAVLRGGTVSDGTLRDPPAQLITDFLSYNMALFSSSRFSGGDDNGDGGGGGNGDSGGESVPHEAEGGPRLRFMSASHPPVLTNTTFSSGTTFSPGTTDRVRQGTNLIDGCRMEPHWVGDLILEAELEIEPTASGQNPATEMIFSFAKGGRQFYAVLNVASGVVTLGVETFDGENFGKGFAPRAQTPILYSGTWRLRLANVDDRFTLWVNDVAQEFSEEPVWSRPVGRWCPTEADLTPVRIGVRGGGVSVSGLRLFRDIYYIATRNNSGSPELRGEIPWRSGGYEDSIETFLSTPSQWELFRRAPEVNLELGDEQYLFCGDNSACSLDGRQWVSSAGYGDPTEWGWDAPQYWVDRSLLKGKAVFLFWPHSWYYIRSGGDPQIPLLPNLERMKRIR